MSIFFPQLQDLALNYIDYFLYMVHGTVVLELVTILQFNYLFVFFIIRISLLE